MPSPLDIYRSAQLLITQHGDAAWLQAVQRADSCNAQGDREGFHIWCQVQAAISELTNATAPSDAPRH